MTGELHAEIKAQRQRYDDMHTPDFVNRLQLNGAFWLSLIVSVLMVGVTWGTMSNRNDQLGKDIIAEKVERKEQIAKLDTRVDTIDTIVRQIPVISLDLLATKNKTEEQAQANKEILKKLEDLSVQMALNTRTSTEVQRSIDAMRGTKKPTIDIEPDNNRVITVFTKPAPKPRRYRFRRIPTTILIGMIRDIRAARLDYTRRRRR